MLSVSLIHQRKVVEDNMQSTRGCLCSHKSRQATELPLQSVLGGGGEVAQEVKKARVRGKQVKANTDELKLTPTS